MVRNSRRFLALFVAVVGTLVFIPLASTAQTRMPQMNFKDRTLANGLRVLSVADSSSPTVAQRLRAPLRTHHVQEYEEHEVGNAGPSD